MAFCERIQPGHFSNATGLIEIGADVSYVACQKLPAYFQNLVISENETNRTTNVSFPSTEDFPACAVPTRRIFGVCDAGMHILYRYGWLEHMACMHTVSLRIVHTFFCVIYLFLVLFLFSLSCV
jgi:hypothetical protein